MTPFKQSPIRRRLLSTTEDVACASIEDTEFMDADFESLESPPSPSRIPFRQSTRNRLFDEGCGDGGSTQTEGRKSSKTFARGSVDGGGRHVDPLNLSFDEESCGDYDTTSFCVERCKRLGMLAKSCPRDSQSRTPTRAYGGYSDMTSFPYISPSSFIVTMDGRCVQSKNPFSPMVTDDTSIPASAAGMDRKFSTTSVAAPSLPVSLEGGTTSRLQKRYANFTRDGYPERNGRYSFTGSPIHEHETKPANNSSADSFSPGMTAAHKIRRLGIDNDVHYPSRGRRNLGVDTRLSGDTKSSPDEVSPTDIFSFPMPPTPQKVKSPGSDPGPPFIGRLYRHRGVDPDAGDMDIISTSTTNCPEDGDSDQRSSRFKSDFDIIGELGKGSFGAVYKVLSRLDGCMYAIKAALRKAKGKADRDRMLKEVSRRRLFRQIGFSALAVTAYYSASLVVMIRFMLLQHSLIRQTLPLSTL